MLTRIYLIFLILTFFLAGCVTTAREAWIDVLSKCASSEALNNVVYFGPSNKVGPGSVWRKSDDSLHLRWTLADIEPDEGKLKNLIQEGALTSCQGETSSEWKLKPSLAFESQATPISAELSADLNRAKSVTVSVDKWAMDLIKEGPFEKWIKSNKDYSDDLKQQDRLVLEKAVRVIGFSTILDFSESDAIALKGKYSQPTLNFGSLGVGMNAEWKSSTKLELKSNNAFYIAGEFSKINQSSGDVCFGIKSTGMKFLKNVAVPVNIKISNEIR